MQELIELYKENLSSRSIKDAVYETLHTAIIKNILPVGYRIKDAEIADMLKTSRSPVRESLQILLRNGLIVSSKSGFCVRKFSALECIDLIKYSTHLRTEAMKIVEKTIDEKGIELLQSKMMTLEKTRETLKNGTLTDCYIEYQKFYYEIVVLTGNTYLCKEVQILQDKLLMIFYSFPNEIKKALDTTIYAFYHSKIIDSLKGKPRLAPAHTLVEDYCGKVNIALNIYNMDKEWLKY